jgi:MADS-box transcription factor
MHPHLQQAGYQHMRHQAPSASPPIPNGAALIHRQTTPQPPGMSRPSSRNHPRRQSSNLVPPQQMQGSQGHAGQNGYAYMPNQPIYNPQAGAGMPVQPAQNQANYPFSANAPQPPQPQAYMQDPQRRSVPPAFSQDRPRTRSPPQAQPQVPPVEPERLPEPKRAPTKSRSIFTPIDESRSFLAQHWGISSTSEPPPKQDPSRSHAIETSNPPRPPPSSFAAPRHGAPSQRSSISSMHDVAPPSRSDSMATDSKRPRLKVQIPSEPSDGGSATAESSPHDSGNTTGGGPSAKGTATDGSHSSGVVLPPPSPSASALLSAGTQGPPNPFARPHPPPSSSANGPGLTSTSNMNGSNANNPSTGNGNNNNIDTPISALPSRFVADGLLPSPSSFYPEWGFGNRSADVNMLPSPLNFQTPITSSGPGFGGRDLDGHGGPGDGGTEKRRGDDEDATGAGGGKRVKIND